MTRRERIKELYEWANQQPNRHGIERLLVERAIDRYEVTERTAKDYAERVVQRLKSQNQNVTGVAYER